MAKVFDGETLKLMVIEGAVAIEAKKREANELNVFPVPDGDTGTNMSMTMSAAWKELSGISEPLVGRVAEITASALLRGARGNSGVILSLLFRGFAKSIKGAGECGGKMFASALSEGVDTAYKAVMKPAEGTILTVSRKAAEAAVRAAEDDDDVQAVFAAAIDEAKRALVETEHQNPVLEKAGVVDSGGFGYVTILEGMYAVLSGECSTDAVISAMPAENVPVSGADFSDFDNEDIKFTYCTEFIVERSDMRRSVSKLRALLESIGDCAVVVDDEEVIKVHVHSDSPDRVLAEGLKFGQLISVKVENMRRQHTELAEGAGGRRSVPPERKYGFVAVAAGDGVEAIFKDMGVDRVVSGGQTMNPSTEDILAAVEQTPAEIVIVLPNNKNIIMAAEQAATICAEKKIVVVPSRTIPQGISAMLAFDPEAEDEVNRAAMTEAMQGVATAQLTYAVRDSEFDGKRIKSGDFIALVENRLHSHGKNRDAVLKKLSRDLVKKDASFITVIYGEGVSEEEANGVGEMFRAASKDAEVSVIYGGQPVYYYIISAE